MTRRSLTSVLRKTSLLSQKSFIPVNFHLTWPWIPFFKSFPLRPQDSPTLSLCQAFRGKKCQKWQQPSCQWRPLFASSIASTFVAGYLKQGLVVDIGLTNHSPTLHNRYSPEQAKRKEVTEGGKKDSVRHGTFSGEADWTGGGLTRVLWWDLGS